MNWFDKLWPFRAAPPVSNVSRSHEVPATAGSTLRRAGMLRPGMWVITAEGRIGILTRIVDLETGQVDLVRDDGSTASHETWRLALLGQAALADIPARRRPDKATAARLGYL